MVFPPAVSLPNATTEKLSAAWDAVCNPATGHFSLPLREIVTAPPDAVKTADFLW